MSGPIFTTIRVIDQRPLFARDHLDRLGLGAALIEKVRGAAAGLADARVRVTVAAGQDPIVEAEAYTAPGHPWRLQPVVVSPDRDRACIKYADRTSYEQARREAGDCDDGLLCLADGTLLECTIANIFLVAGGRLLTPSARAPILPGIARKRVLEAARALGIEARSSRLTLDDARSAEGCFVTNALMVLHPVAAIVGVNRFPPSRLARRLREGVTKADRKRV